MRLRAASASDTARASASSRLHLQTLPESPPSFSARGCVFGHSCKTKADLGTLQPLILRLCEIQIYSTAPLDDLVFKTPPVVKVSDCSP